MGPPAKEWEFFYETPFNRLPFPFHWAQDTQQEEAAEGRQQSNCAAYIKGQQGVMLLEFTRAMDNPDTMAIALTTKTLQYAKAASAVCRAQERLQRATITAVAVVPFIFGVCGAVVAA